MISVKKKKLLYDLWRHLLEKLDDESFSKIFFQYGMVVELKNPTSSSLRQGWSEKKIHFLLTETTPLLLLIVYGELQYYITRLVSLLLWHRACIRHFKRLTVLWLVCAVDQKQDWLGGLE